MLQKIKEFIFGVPAKGEKMDIPPKGMKTYVVDRIKERTLVIDEFNNWAEEYRVSSRLKK